MKEKVIFLVFIILIFMPFASASFLDRITWKVTVEISNEQIKCIFLDSNSEQKCYNSDGKFSCSGIGSCAVDVSGEKGTKLLWKSSCGGYGETIIDENNEELQFKCPIPVAVTIETPVEIIKEKITCVFSDSSSQQKCFTSDGKFSCFGIGSCSVEVSEANGKQLEWKSSCNSYPYYTLIDGADESIGIKCELPATPSCGNGACESGETCSSCLADCGQCATQEVKDQVKCAFLNSNTEQKCYTSDGKFSCFDNS